MPTLIVIGQLQYPKGSAPTNRIHLYCKSIIKEGGNAYVLSTSSPYNEKQVFPPIGRFENVPYIYLAKDYIRKKNYLSRNKIRLKGIISAYLLLYKISKKDSLCAILYYNTSYYEEIIFKIMSLWFNMPIIRDASEAPEYIKNKKNFIKIRKVAYKYFRVIIYNNVIVISTHLYIMYSKLIDTKKIIKIPILVDINRFKHNKNNSINDANNITYVGYMGGDKDGLLDLIEAYNIVNKSNSGITLRLIGSAPEDDINTIKKAVNNYGLSKKVEFVGQVSSDKIPQYLSESSILVLARPKNNQAQAGFPTKLGEYLASKKPVVITDTGEITKYLKDGISAYIAKPNDIKSIANKILQAINDSNKNDIAERGYEIAVNYFDYNIYGKIMIELISNKKNVYKNK